MTLSVSSALHAESSLFPAARRSRAAWKTRVSKDPSKNDAVSDSSDGAEYTLQPGVGVFDAIQCSLYSLQPEAYWKLESANGAEFWWRFPHENMLVTTPIMLATLAWAVAQQPGSTPERSSGQATSASSQVPGANRIPTIDARRPGSGRVADQASNAPVTEAAWGAAIRTSRSRTELTFTSSIFLRTPIHQS